MSRATKLDAKIECDGKVPFFDIGLARKAAGRREGRRIYKCKHCRFYHVGSVTTPKAKTRRLCIECGINAADPPGRLCVGCEAYMEHQQ